MLGSQTNLKTLARLVAGRSSAGRFCADDLAPPLMVPDREFTVHLLDIEGEGSRRIDTRRGINGDPHEIVYKTGRPSAFVNEDYAISTSISYEDLASMPVVSQQVAAEFLAKVLRIDREKKITATNAALLTSGLTSAPSITFDNASGVPITYLRGVMNTIQDGSGYRPNRYATSSRVIDAIAGNAEFLDHIKHDGSAKQLGLDETANALAKILGLDKVTYCDVAVNTAARGATPSFTNLWGEEGLMCYVEPSPRPVTGSYLLHTVWSNPDTYGQQAGVVDGWVIRAVRNEKRSAWDIIANRRFDIKSPWGDDATADAATLAMVPAHRITNQLTASISTP